MRSSTRSPTSPVRRASLTAGALAALLLAAGCGGSSGPPPVTCLAPVTVTADQGWQLFGSADWQGGCALTVTAPNLAVGERLGVVLLNAGGKAGATPTVAVTGAVPFASPGSTALARAATPLASPELAAQAATRAALAAGHDLVVARRRLAMAEWLAQAAVAPEAARPALATAAAACTPPADPAPLSQRQFCVDKLTGLNGARAPELMTATLVHASAHALFYVTNDRLTAVNNLVATQRSTLWADFEDYYEGTASSPSGLNASRSKRILPSLLESFGPESDVDHNCKVIFLFANLVRWLPANSNAVVAGFFDPGDLNAQDTSCTSTGSNHADMLYLLDPVTYQAKTGLTPSAVLDEELPGTIAHELQHNVINNARCVPGPRAGCSGLTDPGGDLWLNEGLSMVSEDQAGFGLHSATERDRVSRYLNCDKPTPPSGGAAYLCQKDASLTTWPDTGRGDVYGHYGGSHAFLRWLLDQVPSGGCLPGAAGGCALTKSIVASTQGWRGNLEGATGLPFEDFYARFTTSALFSGEVGLLAGQVTLPPLTPAPPFSFAAGVPWSPLHTALVDGSGRDAYVAYTPLTATSHTATLPQDGWGAFVSGQGTGGAATLTVTSSAAARPAVVVVRFKGTLPLP